jgi:uncharacterized phage protein (TIGR01671 family)
MREIKFRAWDKCKSRMVFFDLWDSEVSIPASDSPIMQFTGLHDKNGKEIYESDMVRCTTARGYVLFGEVIFEDGTFNVVFMESYYDRNFFRQRDYVKVFSANHSIEVIGNVWGNPELIKEKI